MAPAFCVYTALDLNSGAAQAMDSGRINILISNDDGYRAPGLRALATRLADFADVTVIAPEKNKSGASSSLTLDRALEIQTADNGFHFLDGTPADCVHVAVTSWLDRSPDVVVAGINRGSNVADDVIYSGTIAAAIEGRFLRLPAVAVSLDGSDHYETAADVAANIVQRLARDPLPVGTILNVNVPDVKFDQLKGTQVTRQGTRQPPRPAYRDRQGGDRDAWWVGAAGGAADESEGTDLFALKQSRVSVTPLQIDMTRQALVEQTSRWLAS